MIFEIHFNSNQQKKQLKNYNHFNSNKFCETTKLNEFKIHPFFILFERRCHEDFKYVFFEQPNSGLKSMNHIIKTLRKIMLVPSMGGEWRMAESCMHITSLSLVKPYDMT